MRRLVYLLIIISISCNVQKSGKNTNFGGYSNHINIDSNTKKEIRIIHYGVHDGVIFPASYCEKEFGNRGFYADKKFFTPDTNLIRLVDQEMNLQYCSERRKAIAKFYYNINVDSLKTDSKQAKRYENNKPELDKFSDSDCNIWIKVYPNYDKQYIGYINSKGEKIIKIKLFDFREDPYKMKNYLNISWIDGWHGWFYNNVKEEEFNVTKNLLIVDKNL